MLEHLRRAADGSVLETHPHHRTAIGVLIPVLARARLAKGSELARGAEPEPPVPEPPVPEPPVYG
jgi:hypothetical protein